MRQVSSSVVDSNYFSATDYYSEWDIVRGSMAMQIEMSWQRFPEWLKSDHNCQNYSKIAVAWFMRRGVLPLCIPNISHVVQLSFAVNK